MTKRAKHISQFVDELTELTLNAVFLKVNLNDEKSPTHAKAVDMLMGYKNNLKAHLCEILENNPEQAEALMGELGMQWKKKDSKP